MLYLKFVNNVINDYRTCQLLFDFLKLSLQRISKELIRLLN